MLDAPKTNRRMKRTWGGWRTRPGRRSRVSAGVQAGDLVVWEVDKRQHGALEDAEPRDRW
jgi:hypothetical protein